MRITVAKVALGTFAVVTNVAVVVVISRLLEKPIDRYVVEPVERFASRWISTLRGGGSTAPAPEPAAPKPASTAGPHKRASKPNPMRIVK